MGRWAPLRSPHPPGTEHFARLVAHHLTRFTGFEVGFEQGRITPQWRLGVLRLENVTIKCNADTWTLQLLPRGPLPRRGIRKIVVSGSGAHLRQIETTEINGDVLDMTITTR